MVNIETTYLGLKLKSPVILGSSGLTSSLENIRKNGMHAGAVVLKSLFEEQMLREASVMDVYPEYPEAADYINAYIKDNTLEKYVTLIREAKKECTVPIIASINCTKGGEWVKYAREVETAGADALELNIFFMPESKDQSAGQIEDRYLQTAGEVAKALSIPVSVKLSNHFTNPLYIVNALYFRGVKGVVMFNRFYEPDIDIEDFTVGSNGTLSTHVEMRTLTRWIGRASAEVPFVDYAASSGIESGESVVKMLLAGAKAVQVCSSVYKGGDTIIKYMNDFLADWMQRHGYKSANEFIGMMNSSHTKNSLGYERAQFMKYFSSYQG